MKLYAASTMDSMASLILLVLGFVMSFMLAGAIGANNIANIFGTTVGARVLTFTQTFLVSSIFVTIGALAVGSAIISTIVTDIIDISLYDTQIELLVLEQIAIMAATFMWMVLATLLKLPIAATHSVIGAIVGAHVTAMGFEGIRWQTLAFIALTWITSPILAGVLATMSYMILQYTVLRRANPYAAMVTSLPVWYFLAISFNLLMVTVLNDEWFHSLKIPWYTSFFISVVVATVISLLIRLVVVPIFYKESGREPSSETTSLVQGLPSYEQLELINSKPNIPKTKEVELPKETKEVQDEDEEEEDVELVFKPLLILSVILSSFAYGSIIVSIAVAPLVSILNVYYNGFMDENHVVTPFWIFIFGGIGVSSGFGIAGRGVTTTVGEKFTPIVPSSAFPMELGATTIILLASNIGIPVSTTQCKVGAIVAVGIFKDRSSVGFKVMCDTILAWVVTLPVAGALSAGIMGLLQEFVVKLLQ